MGTFPGHLLVKREAEHKKRLPAVHAGHLREEITRIHPRFLAFGRGTPTPENRVFRSWTAAQKRKRHWTHARRMIAAGFVCA